MTTTLPTPSHGLEYTNSETGDKFKYDSDAGAWEGFEGIDESGDSMTGTIAYPDMLINGNTLTALNATDVFALSEGIVWEWTAFNSPNEGANWQAVAYGNGKFVSISTGGYGNRGMYSEDGGITWVAYSMRTTQFNDITFGAGKFVAVGERSSNLVITSEDGITWTNYPSSNDSNRWQSITYGDGKFVAVAYDGTNRIMYSDDGENWTGVSGHDSVSWQGVTYGGGRFVAVGNSGTDRVAYSSDGINWSRASGHDKNDWKDVAYGDGKFVAVSAAKEEYVNDNHKIMHSTDGINWFHVTGTTWSNTIDWSSIAYGAGHFVAVSYRNNYGFDQTMFSSDGINWTSLGVDGVGGVNWYGVTHGGDVDGRFVAVGSSASRKIMILDAPQEPTPEEPDGSDESSKLYFNGDPVVVDKGQSRALAKSVSGLSSRLGTSRFYQAEEPSDSFGIDNGTLWLNPSNAKLSIYYDSDWNQLN